MAQIKMVKKMYRNIRWIMGGLFMLDCIYLVLIIVISLQGEIVPAKVIEKQMSTGFNTTVTFEYVVMDCKFKKRQTLSYLDYDDVKDQVYIKANEYFPSFIVHQDYFFNQTIWHIVGFFILLMCTWVAFTES